MPSDTAILLGIAIGSCAACCLLLSPHLHVCFCFVRTVPRDALMSRTLQEKLAAREPHAVGHGHGLKPLQVGVHNICCVSADACSSK